MRIFYVAAKKTSYSYSIIESWSTRMSNDKQNVLSQLFLLFYFYKKKKNQLLGSGSTCAGLLLALPVNE